MWLYYLIPIAIHLMFLPFWFYGKNVWIVSLIETVVGTVVIPIYLIVISLKLVDKVSAGKFVAILLSMVGITFLGQIIDYFNWGISTGNLLSPDSVTLLISRAAIIVSTIIVTVGWSIVYFIKSRTV